MEGLWSILQREARERAEQEPQMADFLRRAILDHGDWRDAHCEWLVGRLEGPTHGRPLLRVLIGGALAAQPALHADAAADLRAVRQRDPACQSYLVPYLFYKGYHALQVHRVAHWHWNRRHHAAAHLLQHRCSEVLAIDIHPAARIGCGILLDHGTGFVAGETAVIEDDVNLLHGVTLGGRGAVLGDRHPKVRRGASLGAGVKVLGNIEIGAGAKVGAGSIVLAPIPSAQTAVGIPAHVVAARAAPPPDAPWCNIPASTGECRERALKPVLDGA